jgi:hypothetical protein
MGRDGKGGRGGRGGGRGKGSAGGAGKGERFIDKEIRELNEAIEVRAARQFPSSL